MTVVDKFLGFLAGLAILAVGAVVIWGMFFVLQALVKSMNKEMLSYLMLGFLALPIGYGMGLGIMENRKGVRRVDS